MQIRRLPIGVQSFVSMRRDNYVYADKTAYIYKLITGSKQYFLSRPRRFGKSLFLSTLKAFWEGKKELFDGLQIVEILADNPSAWQNYPVFYFDFNGKNYQKETALEEILNDHLSIWETIYGNNGSKEPEERFKYLLRSAVKQTGLPAVVLVDEYDKPLLEVMENPRLLEYNKAVYKGFFGVLKSYDEYLHFVFITGVTKFSQVSIFSDLNQLDDISFNSAYGDICGISKAELSSVFAPEINKMATKLGLSQESCLNLLKKMYDGYHFSPNCDGVYNPFSLLKAFSDLRIGSYWFATGTPTFLVKRLKETKFDIQRFSGSSLYVDCDKLSDYRTDDPNPLPLLYQTGYLTIKKYDERRQRYILGIPNEEVKYGLLQELLYTYTPAVTNSTGIDINALSDCAENGDTDGMRDILTALFAGIPYSSDNATFEHYFATIIYIVFTLLGKYIKCEVHTAKGRTDAIMETERCIYVFEFKLDKSAAEALEQIETKEYAAQYLTDKRKLYKIGVNFDSKSRNLTQWEVVTSA